MSLEELALAAYTAYGDYLEWDVVRTWLELEENERGAWMAAASRVADLVTKTGE